MPNPPWQRLSTEQLVIIVGDYYRFLTKFYIPESALKYPPEGGWPNVTTKTIHGFPRPPIVVDLLRHLPYIDERNARNMVTNIHYKSDVVDYSTWTADQWANDEQDGVSSVQERIEEYEPEGDGWDEGYLWYRDEERDQDGDPEENWFDGDNPDEMKLEHMIVLADGYGSGGRAIVLDVFKGNIHEDMLECNLLSEVPVEDFFDDLKAKFERLELVPVPGTARREGRLYGDMNGVPEVNDFGESLTADEDDAAQQYKAIWQNFGWPGNDYLKEEAIAAIRLHAERREEADDGGEHAH